MGAVVALTMLCVVACAAIARRPPPPRPGEISYGEALRIIFEDAQRLFPPPPRQPGQPEPPPNMTVRR